uniref:Ubiquitin carboxyl-terminal hydrolase n=1 Tax=Acrobeloides nanus TaxID=290746 RepID=A0A914DZH2_9BILA
MGDWCLIESDPGVFTELIRGFGCEGVQVEELYSLDDESFCQLRPIYGLIFLFKWRQGDEPSGTLDADSKNIFFAQQAISNACATQAIVNLLLNVHEQEIKLGSTLEEFRDFVSGFDSANIGLALSNQEKIRTVHNSFARPQVFELDIRSPAKEDNYHFITYVPINGRIYELDGLREAPIDLGPIKEGEDWLTTVRPIIARRIEKYNEGEIHFNLMAVIGDRKAKYEKRLAEIAEAGMDSDDVAQEVYNLQSMIHDEEEKMKRYRKENVRRRHNYIPFIVEMLKILAKEGKLVPLVEQALDKNAKKELEKEAQKKTAET